LNLKKIRSIIVLFLILSISLLPIAVPYVLGAEDSWKTKASTMQRRELGVIAVNGKVYAIGGMNRENCLNNNMEYDPKTDKWTSKASMLTARANVAVAAYQNKIYVIGGTVGAGAMERYGSGVDHLNVIDVNEVYDTETDTWTTKEPLPTPRWGASANAVNGKLYIIGGFGADGAPTDVTLVYDLETNTWATQASMPTSLGGHASVVVNSRVYVFGGATQWMNWSADLNCTQVYDTENDTWSYVSPMPMTPSYPAAAATTGLAAPQRVYVISYPNITQVYNPEEDTWSTGAEMHTNRATFGVATLNDRIYVIGGGSALFPTIYFSGENEEYTPFGYIPEFPIWTTLLLMLLVPAVALAIYKRRLHKNNVLSDAKQENCG
jgi:N-acetylneuraminic acid mutarotase